MRPADLIRVLGLVFLAVTLIVLGDTAGKLLAQQGVPPLFVAWTRFALAALVLLPLSGLTFAELKGCRDWRVLARGVLIAAGICCILTAVKTEPIANAFGAFFVGPIVSFVLAVLFLKERPTLARSLFLALGFAGVMLVVKPGFGATVGMALAFAAGCFHGSYLAMTRAVAGQFRPRFLLISQLLIGSVLLAPLGLSVPLPPFTTGMAALVAASAAASAAGNYLLVITSRHAEASFIAPLIYLQLLSATVIGFVVFDDLPDVIGFIGLGLIAISGVGAALVAKRA